VESIAVHPVSCPDKLFRAPTFFVSHHKRPYLPIETEPRTDLPGTRLARFGSTELLFRNRSLVPPLATQLYNRVAQLTAILPFGLLPI
jgi:hypothetical protein